MNKKILVAPRINPHKLLPTLCVDTRLVNFLLKAGFLPIVLPISDDFETNRTVIKTVFSLIPEVSGVILQGGKDDVNCNLYAKNQPEIVANRDSFEMDIINESLKQGKSIFGICRGMQMINVAFGGTLIADLGEKNKIHLNSLINSIDYTKFDLETANPDLAHEIIISQQSPLFKIFGQKIMVNSLHHQAVDRLGQGLKIDAMSDDGVVEIISHVSKNILGVQFHPEFDLENHNFKTIVNHWLGGLG